MNHDPSRKPMPHVSDASAPVSVPSFACIVYVSQTAGGVRARVANLPGIDCEASSERDALSRIVPTFKQRVAQLMQDETPIPWIDPPPPEPGEQKRFIPVHL